MPGSFWTIIVILGPVLLGAFILYGYLSNKSVTKREEELSDAGTRALRKDIADDPEKPVDL